MANVNPQQEPYPIKYDSPEGHTYSETHGDADDNITVVTKAEKEGDIQPNHEGTTPDPINPELTEREKERRTQFQRAQSADPQDSKQQQQPVGNKQADKSADK